MVTIPIHNETDYPLTDAMTLHILRDAHGPGDTSLTASVTAQR